MKYASLSQFASQARAALSPKGPYAIVLIEDAAEVDSTIEHQRMLGFREVIAVGAEDVLPDDETLHRVVHDMHETDAFVEVVNTVIQTCPGIWLHYCFNAEYLYFPFCETRNVREMIEFNTEERRDTIMTFVVDLYSNDLGTHPNAVSREAAHLDGAGYYALARETEDGDGLDRQLDFFGGLRWRFEEHIPWKRRKIDRVSLFKARKGLQIRADHTFNDAEYNTYSCPWHHNITAAVCSFRTAKALMTNPGSVHAIPHFWWDHSVKFDWNSSQLMELGLMEPGQWF